MLSPKENKKLQTYVNELDVTKLASAFDALGEPNRCLIFRALLKRKDINVSGLAVLIGISESLASQHLKVLLNVDLLVRTRKGKEVFYALNRQDKIVKTLQKVVES